MSDEAKREEVIRELEEQLDEAQLDTQLGATQREWNRQGVLRALRGDDDEDENE